MGIIFLLETLSALANKFITTAGINAGDEKNPDTLYNKEGISYLNVAPIFGRFPWKNRKRSFDLMPKSIVMEMVLILNLITPKSGLI